MDARLRRRHRRTFPAARRIRLGAVAVWTLCALTLPGILQALASEVAPPAPAIEPAAVTPKPVRIDRTVYLPFNELHVLQKEGKAGILLTRGEYERLLLEAGERATPETEAPPVGAVFDSAVLEARWSEADPREDSLQVHAVYGLRVLSATWASAPFDFQYAAPTSLQLDGQWVTQADPGSQQHRIFVYGAGSHRLDLSFHTKVHREGQKRRIRFRVPQAAAAQFRLTVPGNVSVETNLPHRTVRNGNTTEILAALSPQGWIDLAWSPGEDAAGTDRIPVFAHSHFAFTLLPGLTEASGALSFLTLAGDLPLTLDFVLPEGAQMRDVSGPGLRGWTLEGRTVVVERAPGKTGRLDMIVSYESAAPLDRELALPFITIPKVFRHYGEIAVLGDPLLQVETRDPVNLEPIDTRVFFGGEIDAAGRFLATWRYFAEPIALGVQLTEVQTFTEATIGSWVELGSYSIHRERNIEFFQRKGIARRLRFVIPENEEFVKLLDAGNREIDVNRRGAEIRLELTEGLQPETSATYLLITRMNPAGYHAIDEAGLALTLSAVRLPDATRVTGTVAVGADPRFRITDLRTVDLDPVARPPERPEALQAFFFRDNYTLDIRVAPKPSDLDAVVSLALLPKQGHLSVHGEVLYRIRNAPRQVLQIAFPKTLGRRFYPEGLPIQELHLDESGEQDIWTITLQDPQLGDVLLRFRGDLPVDGVLLAPEVVIPGARREEGTLLVEANTETEIVLETDGLSSIPYADAPPLRHYTPQHRVIAAYRYALHPYRLSLTAIRHPKTAVAALTVDRMTLTSVLSPDGTARHSARYQVRGANAPFLDIVLPRNSFLWSTTLNGEPLKPMEAGGLLRLPLGDSLSRDTAVAVEVIYESPAPRFRTAGKARIPAPILSGDIPVSETSWAVCLPEEYHYSSVRSDLKEQRAPVTKPYFSSAAKALIQGLPALSGVASLEGRMRRDSAGLQRHPAPLGEPVQSGRGLGYIGPGAGPKSSIAELMRIGRRGRPAEDRGVDYAREVAASPPGQDASDPLSVRLPGGFVEQDAEITDVLLRLGSAGGLTILPTREINGRVNFAFDSGVSIREVLDTVLPQYGWTYQYDGSSNLLMVMTREQTQMRYMEEGHMQDVDNDGDGTTDHEVIAMDLAKSSPPVDQPAPTPVIGLPAMPAAAAFGQSLASLPIVHGGVVAGILPFQIELRTQGVQYLFRGLHAPEGVEIHYRRLSSYVFLRLLTVLFSAGVFVVFALRRRALVALFWSAFVLTAFAWIVPSWTALANQLLLGVLLGFVLLLALRLRNRRPARSAAAALLLAVLAGAAPADAAVVFVPYDPASPATATRSDQVYVPYERFETLWAAARANRSATEPVPAPVDFALDDAEYTVTVSEAVIAIAARFRLFVPRETWTRIPLPFNGADLESALVNGAPARIHQATSGLEILMREPGSHRLELQFRLRAPELWAQGAIRLAVPPTFATRVRVLLPDPALTADIQPDQGGKIIRPIPGGVEVVSSIGNAPEINIQWRLRAEETTHAIQASVHTEIRQAVVGPIENWEAVVRFDYPGGERSQFTLALPPDLALTSVRTPNLRTWSLDETGPERMLTVNFLTPVKDSATLTLSAERRPSGDERTAPLIRVPEARKSSTGVLLLNAPWLDLRVRPRGFAQANSDRPIEPALRSAGYFESASTGASLEYTVTERDREIVATGHYLFQVDHHRIEQILILNLDVRRRPLFRIAIDLPEGYRAQGIQGAAVKDWWETSGGRVDVEFARAVEGRERILIHLIRRFDERPATLEAVPARIVLPDTNTRLRMDGSVLIAAHVAVRPRPVEETGLRSADLCEEDSQRPGCRVGGGFTVTLPLEPKLGYWFDEPDFAATFVLETVEPRANAEWIAYAQTHETWVSYSTHVRWKLTQGSRREFQFAAPAGLGEIRVTGENIRETSFVDGVAGRLYTVHLDAEAFDEVRAILTFETPIDGEAELPRLSFPGATRVDGYLIVSNQSPYELDVLTDAGAKASQSRDFPYLPAQTPALGYYRMFGEQWAVTLRLSRTINIEAVTALLNWVEIETLIRRDGTTLNRATVRLLNRTLQFLPVRLPEDTDVLSLFVAGEAVGANRATAPDGQEQLLVPLIRTAPGDLSYDVEIIYVQQLKSALGRRERFAFRGPVFPGLPVGQTFWTFHVPEEYGVHRVGGNMDETVRVLAEALQIQALEEERQQLKRLLLSDADLKVQKTAASNYRTLQQHILRANVSNSAQNVLDPSTPDPPARVNVQALARTKGAVNAGIAERLEADLDGAIEGRIRQIEVAADDARSDRAVLPESITWFFNGDWSDESPAQPRDQRSELREVQTDAYFQVGGNVFIGQEELRGVAYVPSDVPEGGSPLDTSQLTPSYRQSNQYLNFEQSVEGESQIQVFNDKLIGAQLIRSREEPQTLGQRAGGRFRESDDQPQSLSLLDGWGTVNQSVVDITVADSRDSALAGALKPTSFLDSRFDDGFAKDAKAAPTRREGIHSIRIHFPTEGIPITFQKLQSGAEVQFTLLDRQVPSTLKRLGLCLLLAAIAWILIQVAFAPAFWTHLRRRRWVYAFLAVIVILPLNLWLAMVYLAILLIVYKVARAGRRRQAA